MFNIASENALIFYLDEEPSEKSINRLKYINELFQQILGPDLISTTPSYQSILIQFNALTTDHAIVKNKLTAGLNETKLYEPKLSESKLVRLPVYYDESTGPDLARMAEHLKLTIEDIVAKHCMNVYQVFAIGFAPGFAYLGDVDQQLAMPRLGTPRESVPKGSVGIADRQTAIYPAASPGGWNIIGRCPSTLFDSNNAPHMPFQVGDRVQFMPISAEEYAYLGGE